uniref:Putative secreted protein n=1 Tax=Anopheles marajoara TaxID=58244 RepID=A0A2M4CGN8_9DIPT
MIRVALNRSFVSFCRIHLTVAVASPLPSKSFFHQGENLPRCPIIYHRVCCSNNDRLPTANIFTNGK